MIPAHLLNTITTGDARELCKALPDESVDLVFTDPVYDRIDDYRWLAETAARVLKPDGACLVWSNGKWHRTNANWLEFHGLVYRWDFCVIMFGGPQPMNGRIIAKTQRIIWLDKHAQSKLRDYWPDGFISADDRSLQGFKWTKSPRYTAHAITNLSSLGDIVLDPFAGGGTIPAVCKMLGRDYVAFEIDPVTAEKARERVLHTQMPLPGLLYEQATLEAV